jgi:hypothetical protein
LEVGSGGSLAIQGFDGTLPYIVKGSTAASLRVAFILDDAATTALERLLQRLHGPGTPAASRRA